MIGVTILSQLLASNNSGRTAQECKVRWLGSQHPKFNSHPWDEGEVTSLHDLVESKRESGQLDWEEIPNLLGVNLCICISFI